MMPWAFGRCAGLLLTALAIGMMCLGPLRQAEAAPRWSQTRVFTWEEIEAAGMVKEVVNNPSLLMADRRWANEDWSALMLNLPAEMATTVPHNPNGTPYTVVFAVYDEQTATGSIVLMRSVLTLDRRLVVMVAPFRPTSWEPRGPLPLPDANADQWPDLGVGDADYTESRWIQHDSYWNRDRDQKIFNPFDDFKGHPDGKTFIKIQPAAFYSAVGAAMAWGRAPVGWVANLVSTDEVKKKKSGSALRKKVKYTKKTWVTPQWMVAVPAGMMTTGADTYAFCFPAVDCGDAQGVGRTDNARTFIAGVNLQVEGDGSSMPHERYLAFEHSRTYSSWTFLAMVVFTAVLAAATAGAVAALGGPNLATALGMNAIGGQAGVGAAAATGAAIGATTNAAWNYSQGVHSLTDTVDRVFASGVSPIESMHDQENEWDSRPAVRAMVEAGPLATPGATGQFYTSQQPAEGMAQYGRTLWPGQMLPQRYDPFTGLPTGDPQTLSSVTPTAGIIPQMTYGTPQPLTSLATSAWEGHVDTDSGRPYQQASVAEGTLFFFAREDVWLKRTDGSTARGMLRQTPDGGLIFTPYR